MQTPAIHFARKTGSRPGRAAARRWPALVGGLLLLIGSAGAARAQSDWPQVALSKDGVPVSYEVRGSGEPALVFVHGWSCDARYWRNQVPYFSKTHRVVVLDLAGHGHSGMARTAYTMASFGEDVRAVVEAAGARQVIDCRGASAAAVLAALRAHPAPASDA